MKIARSKPTAPVRNKRENNNNSQWDCYLHGHKGEQEIPHYRAPGYETNCLTDMALEHINHRSETDRPFFMVVSVQPPHWPNLAPAAYRRYQSQHLTLRPNVPAPLETKARCALSGYYAQIENVDANVGRLLDGLQLIGDRESGYAWRCVVTHDGWKYACVEGGEWLLFNLNNDPHEQNNLAFNTSYQGKRDEMKALLQDWIVKTGDSFPLPLNLDR